MVTNSIGASIINALDDDILICAGCNLYTLASTCFSYGVGPYCIFCAIGSYETITNFKGARELIEFRRLIYASEE